ncbi:MAG: hypothetical protein ACP5VE_14820 [Chthonomonadales bacterium]
MVRRAVVFSIAALLAASVAVAGAPKQGKPKAKAAKVVEVKVCPMDGMKAMGTMGGVERVGNYNVHFCGKECKQAFDKLSPKEKIAKVQAVLKKSAPAHPAKKKMGMGPGHSGATLVSLEYCPMTGEKVKGAGGGSVVFENYKVNFCCAGCKAPFEKLTDAQKRAKIAAVLHKTE